MAGNIGREVKKIMGEYAQPQKPRLKPSDFRNEHLLLMAFNRELVHTIIPKDQSDRTTFRRLGVWAVGEYQQGRFTAETLNSILLSAWEAAGPRSRNPAAVFLTILKNEMGYKP